MVRALAFFALCYVLRYADGPEWLQLALFLGCLVLAPVMAAPALSRLLWPRDE